MKPLNIIVSEINQMASGYKMGKFQEIRQRIHQLSRVKTRRIFSENLISPLWTFHSGGRKEIQFNIGYEGEENRFRYGLALSFQTSRSLPDPTILFSKAHRFNSYVEKNAPELGDLNFWHWNLRGRHTRSSDRPVKAIPQELITKERFLMVGKFAPCENTPTSEDILFLFDRLLSVYEFVEDESAPLRRHSANLKKGFIFRPGFRSRPDLPPIDQTK